MLFRIQGLEENTDTDPDLGHATPVVWDGKEGMLRKKLKMKKWGENRGRKKGREGKRERRMALQFLRPKSGGKNAFLKL